MTRLEFLKLSACSFIGLFSKYVKFHIHSTLYDKATFPRVFPFQFVEKLPVRTPEETNHIVYLPKVIK